MGQNMDICVPPFDQFAVHPDFSITVIIASHFQPPFANVAQIKTETVIKLRKL
jgi:hypothetical protein